MTWKSVLNDAEWETARWFVRGPEETDLGMPRADDLKLFEVILERSLFVNQYEAKRILTADQAKSFLAPAGSGENLSEIGVDNDHELLVIHKELLLSGSQPVSVALLGPTVEKGGELEKVTNANKILAEGGRAPSDVFGAVRNHILNAKPGDPKTDDEITKYDSGLYLQFSLTGVGFTFSDVENSANFKTITDEPATTNTQSQRTIGLKPQAVLGLYSPRIEWENSFTVDFSTNRIGPNASPNALSDLWRPRSEIDGYWAKRRKINFPLYFAVQLESQFRAPFGVINLADLTKSTPVKVVNQPAPLVFSEPKRRAFSGELGAKIANRDKTMWFRIGWERVANRSRVTNIVLDENGFAATGTPGTIAANVNAINLAQFLAGNQAPFVSGTAIGNLTISPTTVNGIAFGYQITHDFHPSKKDSTKKITFTSKSNEWDFYSHNSSETSSQPRFRLWVVNSLSVPLIGNLSLKPAFEFFVYRTQPDAVSKVSQTQTSWRPSMTLEYSFDWKPRFLNLRDSLKFNNAAPKSSQ